MKYQIQSDKLKLPGGELKQFQYEIKEIAEFDALAVVVLRVPAKHFLTENVYGVSETGEVLWQIERIPETGAHKENYYTGISNVGPDWVRVANWNDVVVDLNPQTGKVLKKHLGRFT